MPKMSAKSNVNSDDHVSKLDVSLSNNGRDGTRISERVKTHAAKNDGNPFSSLMANDGEEDAARIVESFRPFKRGGSASEYHSKYGRSPVGAASSKGEVKFFEGEAESACSRRRTEVKFSEDELTDSDSLAGVSQQRKLKRVPTPAPMEFLATAEEFMREEAELVEASSSGDGK